MKLIGSNVSERNGFSRALSPVMRAGHGWRSIGQTRAIRLNAFGKDRIFSSTASSAAASRLAMSEENLEDEVIKEEELDAETPVDQDGSLLLKNCGLSAEIVIAMERRGITSLFPIQKHVFDPAMSGIDLIGRAKTGSGKTLAFAIPIVEKLLKENKERGERVDRGRPPRAIVITPTRELANQVSREFQSVCPSLIVKAFYGGVPIGGNKRDLSFGVDVAVGTPGRLMDLVRQRALDLGAVRFAILDESDQMLDMGFEEDMEEILAYTPPDKQTMLFSATLPSWVRKVARKYLKNHQIVDLLGEEGTGKISDTITALGILVHDQYKKPKLLGDILSMYAAGKQSIVFTQTKREADAVHSICAQVLSANVLHGDIAQGSREVTLKNFRAGKFSCLVATDVAARGLDIPSVDLVVHYDCPQTQESFVHRSGRTGRAGNKGTTLVMMTESEVQSFYRIVSASGTSVEMIGPPTPREVMQASTRTVLDKMKRVSPEVIEFFSPAASKLMESSDGTQVLAAALAAMSGFEQVPKPRSLLAQAEGMVTIRLVGSGRQLVGFSTAINLVESTLGESVKVGAFEPIRDYDTATTGALLDLPADQATRLLQKVAGAEYKGVRIDLPKALSLDQIVSKLPRERSSRRRSRLDSRSPRRGYDDSRGWSRRGDYKRGSGRWSDSYGSRDRRFYSHRSHGEFSDRRFGRRHH